MCFTDCFLLGIFMAMCSTDRAICKYVCYTKQECFTFHPIAVRSFCADSSDECQDNNAIITKAR